MTRLKGKQREAKLIDRTTSKIRFSEVDSMQIVWHGVYVKFFEDGRESFGRKYKLGYMDVYSQGYMTPIVTMQLNYKLALAYGDELIVETRYLPTEAAKIEFEYTIYRSSDMAVAATGSSIQVFLDTDRQLVVVNPPFYLEWQKQWEVW